MPYAEARGARLYYEEIGSGFPIVFVHGFAGDMRDPRSISDKILPRTD